MVLASGVVAILVSGAFVVLLLAIENLRESADETRDAREELIAADRLEKLVIDLETGVRGFVITGEESFLAPWNKARAAFPDRPGGWSVSSQATRDRCAACGESPATPGRTSGTTRRRSLRTPDEASPPLAASR